MVWQICVLPHLHRGQIELIRGAAVACSSPTAGCEAPSECDGLSCSSRCDMQACHLNICMQPHDESVGLPHVCTDIWRLGFKRGSAENPRILGGRAAAAMHCLLQRGCLLHMCTQQSSAAPL